MDENFDIRRASTVSAISGFGPDTPMTQPAYDHLSMSYVSVYKRRWWMLAMFCVVGMINYCIWNTWSPINLSAKAVFDWTNNDIELLSDWGLIMILVTVQIFSFIMDKWGLRVAVLLTAGLVAVGSALRCITSHPEPATWLIHSGHILNGMGGVVPMAGATLLSVTWFPNSERRTATATCTMTQYVGMSMAFVIGPALVNQPVYNSTIHTDSMSVDSEELGVPINLSDMRTQIMTFMYIECGAAILAFLLVLVYFPAKPNKPPSISAETSRMSFIKGTKKLLKKKSFWLICLTYSLFTGIFNSFVAVLPVDLEQFHMEQTTAGWVGFFATIVGAVYGLIVARISDMIGHVKMLIFGQLVLAATFFYVYTLIAKAYIPYSLVGVYVCIIGTSCAANGIIPLSYELACDMMYPIAEEVVSGWMVFIQNIVGVFFLLAMVTTPPESASIWVDWTVLVGIAAGIPLIMSLKERYKREEIEDKIEHQTPIPYIPIADEEE